VPPPSPLRSRAISIRTLGVLGMLVITLAGAIVAAAYRSPWGTVLALLLSVVTELALFWRWSSLAVVMRRVGAGSPALVAVRMIAVLLLAARCLDGSIAVGTAITAAVVIAITVGAEAARVLVAKARRLPLVARGLDLGDVALPPSPRQVLTEPRGYDAAVVLPAALGLWYSSRHGGSSGVATGLAVTAVFAAIPVVVLGLHLLGLRRAGLRQRMTDAVNAALERLAPRVVLYFAATPGELYQVRMWLEPIAALDQPAVIVVRSFELFEALGEVGLPVVCTPYNGVMASLALPDVVVAMFVTHSGNNLSMLRRPEARSVFVGHGDSDKPDSVNPFARVYDEVWVAGPLGRRRYETAGVGIADEAIVEVGRPQIAAPTGPPPRPPTIVYAPTWEGWGDDPHHSSLAQVGPALIAALASRSDLRVRYRPHPLTGNRDPALQVAHQRIIELVGRVPNDEPIAETFAGAGAVIGDVSSVINEFLPYDRPYAVVDTRDLGAAAFVARFPSTAGGFIIDADLRGLDEFVVAASGGPDPTAPARRTLLADALGDPATSQQRFAAAVAQLLSR
jgi:CDP-Glycerol:Poly(glycerophosphate) glycerophosphotransferase